jgi:hypothetical protein
VSENDEQPSPVLIFPSVIAVGGLVLKSNPAFSPKHQI